MGKKYILCPNSLTSKQKHHVVNLFHQSTQFSTPSIGLMAPLIFIIINNLKNIYELWWGEWLGGVIPPTIINSATPKGGLELQLTILNNNKFLSLSPSITDNKNDEIMALYLSLTRKNIAKIIDFNAKKF